jgi:hypothetical protein
MDLPNAIERLRNVLRRQHKAIAANFKVPLGDTSAALAPLA